MKIAIIRFSALGDIIVSASILSCIKQFYPHCVVHWYVDSRFSKILSDNEILDKVYEIPLKQMFLRFNLFAFWHLYQELHSREYDCVIDMQGLMKSSLIGKALRTKHYIGFDRHSAKERWAASFYTLGVNIGYQESIVKRNAYLLYSALNHVFGLQVDFDFFLSTAIQVRDQIFSSKAESQKKIDCILEKTSQQNLKKYKALFVLEASMDSKTYASSHFIELGEMLLQADISPIILWHGNRERACEITDGIGEALLLPCLSLDELIPLMKAMDVVVGGDTGVTHLAWALKRPSVTLYGNTPKDRFALPDERCVALSGNENANYDRHDFSINKILPETIFCAIKKILEVR